MVRSKASKAPAKTPKPSPITGKRKRSEVQTKECVICIETRPLYRNFPTFTTCSHEPDTCSICVAKQTVTLLEASLGKGWSACTCPQCNVSVPTEELQSALPRALVKEMKEMVGKTGTSTDDRWRWCLAPGCGHGSLQDGRHEVIRCRKCDYKMCFGHQIPWHNGYTCHDYDTSHPQAAITRTNEEMIKQMSKPCPGCGIAVEKVGGCDHMYCRKCGTSWQWNSVPSAGGHTMPTAPTPAIQPLPVGRRIARGLNTRLEAGGNPFPVNTPTQPAPDMNGDSRWRRLPTRAQRGELRLNRQDVSDDETDSSDDMLALLLPTHVRQPEAPDTRSRAPVRHLTFNQQLNSQDLVRLPFGMWNTLIDGALQYPDPPGTDTQTVRDLPEIFRRASAPGIRRSSGQRGDSA